MSEEAPRSGAPQRVLSIDALRGFDMALLMGGAAALIGVSRALGLDSIAEVLAEQTEHPEWNGFTAWDLVFPLFLFLAGASMPFSFAKRRASGETRGALVRHAVMRGAALVALGVVYNGFFGSHLFAEDGRELRYASVLGRIGLAWMLAAFAVIALPRTKALVGVLVGCLALHSALLLGVPAPGLDGVSLAPGETFPDWIDSRIVPGRLHRTVRDPEGLVGVIPAVGTALLGVLAGRWIQSGRGESRPRGVGATSGPLALAGAALLAVSYGADAAGLPINKNLWTASFVAHAGGWSLLLLALFHLAFDGLRLERLGAFFQVLGANSILVYLVSAFVSWSGLAEVVFALALRNGRLAQDFVPLAGFLLQWLVFYGLWRRRIFLRV
ncbi:MAG: DUF5009 domain-containing protein [Planctomycetota bacterium]